MPIIEIKDDLLSALCDARDALYKINELLEKKHLYHWQLYQMQEDLKELCRKYWEELLDGKKIN